MQLTEMLVLMPALGLLVLGWVLSRKIAREFYGGEVLEAQRPWNRYLNIVVIMWTVSLITFNVLRNTGRLTHPSMVSFGVAAMAIIGLAAIWIAYRRLLASDEFIRRIHTEILALAFGLSVVGALALWQLAGAGIIEGGANRIALAVFHALGASSLIVHLRYR